jgi:WD40 repeat protein
LLASGSDDETVRLWRLPHSSGRAPWQCVGVLHGHVSNVFSSMFVPGTSDDRVVTGGNDGTCRLYDVNTQTQLSVMCHHFRKVQRVLHARCTLCHSPLRFSVVHPWTPTRC